MADYEPVLRGRRYVLGETADFYGIWERRTGRGPFERFPLTAEGFEAAERRFHELSRRSTFGSGTLARVLVGVTVVASIVWVAAVLFSGITTLISPELFSSATAVAYVVEAASFRVALGAVLVALALAAGSVAHGGAGPTSPARPSGLDRGLLWLAMISLAVWVLTAIGTRVLEPQALVPPEFGGEAPTTATILWQVLEALSFRLWVAALVLLGLRWLVTRFVADAS